MPEFTPLRPSGTSRGDEFDSSDSAEEGLALGSPRTPVARAWRASRRHWAGVASAVLLGVLALVAWNGGLGGLAPREDAPAHGPRMPALDTPDAYQLSASIAAASEDAEEARAAQRADAAAAEAAGANGWQNATRGGPVSFGPHEDEAAWQAARENAAIFEEMKVLAASGNRPMVWVPIGSNQVVDDEGKDIKSSPTVQGSLEECETACDANDECNSFTVCGGTCYLKDKVITAVDKTHYNSYCNSYYKTADTYRPSNKALAQPSSAPQQTFYVYRAQAPPGKEGDYPLANVNVASIGGVMWYLHDEVIRDCWFGGKAGQRRFGITRIRRFKLTTRATQPLIDKNMHFGLKCSMDSGECTGPHRDHVEGVGTGWHSTPEWDKYGYYVGCNKLGEWPHNEFTFQSGRRYPRAIWYSLPGPCPTMNYRRATKDCKIRFPGGLCDDPDGRGNCTYSVEEAGEIDIDELVGITPKWSSRAEFCKRGGFEGDKGAWGHMLSFWNNIWDSRKNEERVQAALDLFKKKYPNMPSEGEFAPPACDWTTKNYW